MWFGSCFSEPRWPDVEWWEVAGGQDGSIDAAQRRLCVTIDTYRRQFLRKISLADIP